MVKFECRMQIHGRDGRRVGQQIILDVPLSDSVEVGAAEADWREEDMATLFKPLTFYRVDGFCEVAALEVGGWANVQRPTLNFQRSE
jgi:hypothetical protein